jgi:hypothetical protein
MRDSSHLIVNLTLEININTYIACCGYPSGLLFLAVLTPIGAVSLHEALRPGRKPKSMQLKDDDDLLLATFTAL